MKYLRAFLDGTMFDCILILQRTELSLLETLRLYPPVYVNLLPLICAAESIDSQANDRSVCYYSWYLFRKTHPYN